MEMYKTFHDQFKYDVHELINPTKNEMIKLLQRLTRYFAKDFKGSDINNPDGGRKIVVFAFAGHGGTTEQKSDYILGRDGEKVSVISDIVNAFLGHMGTILRIPKLFFFDACRGNEWLYAAPDRGDEENEVNYRIDYATIPEHKAPTVDRWMQFVAKTLREKNVSFGDVMAEVKQMVYEQAQTFPQQPDTRDRLVTGPLMLWYNGDATPQDKHHQNPGTVSVPPAQSAPESMLASRGPEPKPFTSGTIKAEVQMPSMKPVMEWESEEVCQWLEEIGLGEYCHQFRKNEIRGEHLLELTQQDLTELEMKKMGHKKTFLIKVKELVPS
jgi:hypothetical protein